MADADKPDDEAAEAQADAQPKAKEAEVIQKHDAANRLDRAFAAFSEVLAETWKPPSPLRVYYNLEHVRPSQSARLVDVLRGEPHLAEFEKELIALRREVEEKAHALGKE